MALTRYRDGDERLGAQLSVSGRQAIVPAALLVDASGNAIASPSGAADSGDPIKVGGVYNATLPTLADGQRGNVQLGTRGSINVQLMTPDSAFAASFGGDSADAVATTATSNRLQSVSRGYAFNGTTWDRQRGDTNGLAVQPALSANFWNYAAATGGIVNTTTAVTIKAAAGASVRNYLSSLQIDHDALGGATEIAIRDGAAGTVLWRGKLQTTATEGNAPKRFNPPLKGTANTLMEVVTLTAVTGGVFVNAQGYTGA